MHARFITLEDDLYLRAKTTLILMRLHRHMSRAMHESSYLDPLGSRLPAMEQNMLKLRSAQMLLVLFCADQLKARVLSLTQCTDGFMAHTGRAERVPQGTRNPVSKSLDALEADGALSADAKAEIRRLIDYRNSVGLMSMSLLPTSRRNDPFVDRGDTCLRISPVMITKRRASTVFPEAVGREAEDTPLYRHDQLRRALVP